MPCGAVPSWERDSVDAVRCSEPSVNCAGRSASPGGLSRLGRTPPRAGLTDVVTCHHVIYNDLPARSTSAHLSAKWSRPEAVRLSAREGHIWTAWRAWDCSHGGTGISRNFG